jgi:hypothetical protein
MAMVTLAPSRRLLDAAKHGDIEGCLAAFGAGADLNSGDPSYGGYTAMHLVAENGHAVCLKWLVDAGATTDALTKDDETPMHWAAWKGHASCAKQLAQAGAPLDARSKNGETALHWAAEYGHAAVAQVLLDAGAQVDAKSNYGRTPLHHAVMSNNVDCVLTLIQHGATVDVPDRLVEGTPLDLATTDEMRMILEKPEEIMAQAIKAHYARSRELQGMLGGMEAELEVKSRETVDALREAEEARDRMQVEMSMRQNAEKVTEETQNRLEAEKQARRLAERKLEETKKALKAEQEKNYLLEQKIKELQQQKAALAEALAQVMTALLPCADSTAAAR